MLAILALEAGQKLKWKEIFIQKHFFPTVLSSRSLRSASLWMRNANNFNFAQKKSFHGQQIALTVLPIVANGIKRLLSHNHKTIFFVLLGLLSEWDMWKSCEPLGFGESMLFGLRFHLPLLPSFGMVSRGEKRRKEKSRKKIASSSSIARVPWTEKHLLSTWKHRTEGRGKWKMEKKEFWDTQDDEKDLAHDAPFYCHLFCRGFSD